MLPFLYSITTALDDWADRMSENVGLGALEDIEVERAIAEVRAGRPVFVSGGGASVIVLCVEALEAGNVEKIASVSDGAAQLLLTSARLRHLGSDQRKPGFLSLPSIDLDRIAALAGDPHARLDAPVMVASPLHETALRLLRLAHVLPAALVYSACEAPRGVLTADASAVDAYDHTRAQFLRIVSRAQVPLEHAPGSEFVLFRGGEGLRDQVAIIVGAPDLDAPVIVRLHSACLTGDLFGSLKCDCGDQLRDAVRHMADNGGGVLLYLDQEGRGNGISNKIRAYDLQSRGFDTFEADAVLGFDEDGRTFSFAAKMLTQLGVSRVRLMTNNPAKIGALEAAGLVVVSHHRIFGRRNHHNIRYLASKRDRAGHFLD